MSLDAHTLTRAWHLPAPLEDVLADWLPTRRWFGGKGYGVTSVRVVDAAWLGLDPDTPLAWVLAEVSFADAAPHHYSLWLGIDAAADGSSVVSPLVSLADVAATPSACLRQLLPGASIATAAGGRLMAVDVDGQAVSQLLTQAARPIGAEQSNTSIRVGGELVLKLFRRLQAGENPEAEVLRFLSTRTTFTDIARPHGAFNHVDAHGTIRTLGLVQEWVPNQGDGWRFVVSKLEACLDDAGAWPAWAGDMAGLGRVTAGFHRASASDATDPDFAPRLLDASDIDGLRAALVRSATALQGRLAGCDLPPGLVSPLTQALDAIATSNIALPKEASAAPAVGIRVHGDYHLGQTLRTSGGFVMIDFEGEPGRPLEERRQRHHALKDVAGMLRSFEYALAVAAGRRPDAIHHLRAIIHLDDAFLRAYFESMAGSGLVPEDEDSRRLWLRFFTLEKAVYELAYELDNRPTWAAIPGEAIVRFVDDA